MKAKSVCSRNSAPIINSGKRDQIQYWATMQIKQNKKLFLKGYYDFSKQKNMQSNLSLAKLG